MTIEGVRLNRRAMAELLRSAEVAADLEDRAERIAAAAGPGHRVDAEVGPRRARAAVITTEIPAMLREAQDRNLTRAVDAAR